MEKRKYQRLALRAQQRVLSLVEPKRIDRNIVISKNVSAEGFCFRSNRPYQKEDLVLVYLQDHFLADVELEMPRILKSGNYVMARVMWSKPVSCELDPFYEIGCGFIKKEESDVDNINLFTQLINQDTVERISLS